MTTRLFTALKEGKVVRKGTFNNEELLLKDLPSPEYELILDQHLDFPLPEVRYVDTRRLMYPPIADFADAYYWATQGDSSKMDAYLAKVSAVKLANPK